MPERLKDLFFSDKFIKELGDAVQNVYPDFDLRKFNHLISDDDWDNRELKQKMRHITHSLAACLPKDYPTALNILTIVAPKFGGFDAMIFPDFVECYGLDDWRISLDALSLFTRFASSEFAIRPFLAKDPKKGMSNMYKWAKDKNHHVRRLASEGCRPRLPWAMALTLFKNDPSPIVPIMEVLKDDPSEYVRKSVANNLNDISKDHPELVLDTCEQWYGQSKNTDWIVKRAYRTLLKAGNKRALLLFDFGDPENIVVGDLAFDKQKLTIGEDLNFAFELRLDTEGSSRLRLEYSVSYVKANGKLSSKVFQIKEANYQPGRYNVSKKHSFKDLSTRKHYPGQHQITILVNGVEKMTGSFELT